MRQIINPASERHGKQMQKLLDVIRAETIEYKDLGNGENYVITMPDDQKVTLRVRGNKYDGGFLSIPETFEVGDSNEE